MRCKTLPTFGLEARERDKVGLGLGGTPSHSEAPSWAGLTGWESRRQEQSPLTLREGHPGTSGGILPRPQNSWQDPS